MLADSDIAATIRVLVTASDGWGSAAATSAQTGAVQALTPSNTALPSISGTPQSGQTLTASSGTWSGSAPLTYSYQWQDCGSAGTSCTVISGATASTYTLASSDVGDTIVVVVTASNAGLLGGGSVQASSTATSVVSSSSPTGYPATVLADDPVAFWQLNDSVLPNAADASGNGNTGTYSSGVTSSMLDQAGIDGGGSLALTGDNSAYVQIPVGVLPNSAEAFTAQAWFKTSSTSGIILSRESSLDNPSSDYGPIFYVDQNGYLNGQIWFDGSSHPLLSKSPVDDGLWHEVTLTVDASGLETLWLDGLEQGTGTLGSVTQQPAYATIGVGEGTYWPRISGWTGFNGQVADVALYDSTLSQLQLAAQEFVPKNQLPPTVTGTASDGYTLTATAGSWMSGAPTYSYQWLDCNSTGSSCTPISAATSASYTLQPTDIGYTVEVTVTATNSAGSASAISAPTAVITASAPVDVQPLALTGSEIVGSTLTAGGASWRGTGTISYSYQWYDCTTASSCTAVSGATGTTYVLSSADLGDFVEAIETATSSYGSTTSVAQSTYQIVSGPPSTTSTPSISGAADSGDVVTAVTGTWTQTPTSYNYQWEDCTSQLATICTAISGATGGAYTLTTADVGKNIAVRVSAINQAGTSSMQTSITTGTVGAPFSPYYPYDGVTPSADSDVWVWAAGQGVLPFDLGAGPQMTAAGEGVCGGYCNSSSVYSFGQYSAGTQVDFQFCTAWIVHMCGTAITKRVAPDEYQLYWEAAVVDVFVIPTSWASTYGLPGGGLQNSTQCHTADPVNCGSGDLTESFTDASTPGRGDPVKLTRTYNSLAASTEGIFGYGWSSSYEMSLSFDDQGDATVNEGDGAQSTFAAVGGGQFKAAPNVLGSLVGNSDGTYTLTERGGNSYLFSARGQLISETDRNGYQTTLAYNSALQLTAMTDPEGRTLTFIYGSNGLVSSLVDSSGRTWTYGYDSSADLTKVTDPDGDVRQLGYDSNHLLTSMTDPDGGTTTNEYDSGGRVVSQSDPAGLTTTFAYSGDNLSTSGGTTTITGPHGQVTVEDYSNGQMTSKIEGYGTSAAGTWSYQYGPTDSVTSTTDPNGNVTTAAYDASGNELTSTNALGLTTTSTYNSFDEPLTIVDPAGVTTTYTYDSSGNVQTKTVTGAGGSPAQATSYTYGDAYAGDLTEITDPAGDVTDYSYDQYGDLASTTTHPASGSNDTTDFAYNALGEKICEASADAVADGTTCAGSGSGRVPGTTTWAYDADGHVTSITDPRGNQTKYAYDEDGDRTQITLPSEAVTKTVYDLDGRTQSVTTGYGSSAALTTSHTYDIPLGSGACASTVATALYCTTTTAPGGQITVSWLNARDQTVQQSIPASGTNTDTYDADGNLLSKTTVSGTSTYGYDATNELTSVTYSGVQSGYATPTNVSYSYNADGDRTQMVDGTGTTTYAYDALQRLTSVTNGDGLTVSYGYDPDDRITSIGYPAASGDTVNYAFDGAGREASVTDWLSNKTTFAYDADGNLLSEAYPGGVTDTSTYDADDDLLGRVVAPSSSPSTVTAKLTYTYDQDGDLASETDTGLPGSGSVTYSYDASKRLTSASSSTYAYDGGSDLTTIAGASGYSYNGVQQLTGAPAVGSSAATNYGYDLLGDRVSAVSGSASTGFAFDMLGELVAVSGSASASYTYNGDGLRTSKTTGGAMDEFAYDTTGSVPQVLYDGQQSYIYGPGGEAVEQISASGVEQYLHVDQLGSTRLVTNESGGTVGSTTYTAYGTLEASTGTVSTPMGFAGGYTDSETGLIYLGARYYDPSTGQFISADPLAAATVQPYQYADSNPVGEIDPAGECAVFSFGGSSCVAEAGRWVYDNSGRISTVASAAAFIPGADVIAGPIAVVTGGMAATRDADAGNYIGAFGDIVGVVGGGAGVAYGWRAGWWDARAAEDWDRSYIQGWEAARSGAYASTGRIVSIIGFVGSELVTEGESEASAGRLCGW